VYEYLYALSGKDKATVILGNHDTFLINMFERDFTRCYFDMKFNGFDKTLESFLGYPINSKTNLEAIHYDFYKKYYHYYWWLKSLPLYYELDKYIFVHGSIDGSLLNWKNTSVNDMIWNKEFEMAGVPGRIVVAGHHRVATIMHDVNDYDMLYKEHPDYFAILNLGDKILIDGFVEVAKKLNVLVIEL